MPDGSTPGQSVEVVLKADEILELLRERGEMTVAQIADGVGEPRSSVYRLISTLEDMGFVVPGSGGYGLGMRLFALGRLVAARLSIIEAARPAMEGLLERTGETVFLLVRDGAEAMCVERLDGSRVRSMAVSIGGTLPLHLGAGPMVLLAHLRPDEAEAYLHSGALAAWTERSIARPQEIRERLPQIRRQGYAISDEDLVPGIAAIGAPVRDAAGEVVAALSVSGPRASLLEAGAEATIALVTAAADSVVAPA